MSKHGYRRIGLADGRCPLSRVRAGRRHHPDFLAAGSRGGDIVDRLPQRGGRH